MAIYTAMDTYIGFNVSPEKRAVKTGTIREILSMHRIIAETYKSAESLGDLY
jgi:chemotaxis signal transduction protein